MEHQDEDLVPQGLWDLVENGNVAQDDEARLKENKKDSKASFFIQQAGHDTIFSRIAAAETSKDAWEILRKKFQGSAKVIIVKLKSLMRDFETLFIKRNESVQDFLSRVTQYDEDRDQGELKGGGPRSLMSSRA